MCVALGLVAGGCGDDQVSPADGGTTETPPDDTGVSAATTSDAVDDSDTTGGMDETTGEPDTGSDTGSDTESDTGTSSGGDPLPVEGHATVLLWTSLGDEPANALYLVEYEAGVAAEPELISGDAVVLDTPTLSPANSLVFFEDDATGTMLYVSIAEGIAGPVTPLHQAPAPDVEYWPPSVNADETLLAYTAYDASTEIYVAEILDGVVQAPVIVAADPPMGTQWSPGFVFSSDGSLLAFLSGYSFNGGIEPAGWTASIGQGPPEAYQVAPSVTGFLSGPNTPQFVPGDGAVWFGSTIDGPTELFLAEVGGLAAPPTKVNLPLLPGEAIQTARASPDGSRLAYFVADDDIWGKLFIVAFDGTTASSPIPIGPDADDISSSAEWSPDQRWLAFRTRGDVGFIENIALVDVSGPVPGDPVLLTQPGNIENAQHFLPQFDATGAWAYFERNIPGGAREAYRVDISGPTPGVPQAIGGHEPDVYRRADELRVSSDGNWFAFTAFSVQHDEFQAVLVEGSGDAPGEPQLLSNPSDGRVTRGEWSTDETAFVYRVDNPVAGQESYNAYAVDRDAPGASALLAANVKRLWVL